MKTHSSKVISYSNSSKRTVKVYSLTEFSGELKKPQELIDNVHDRKKTMDVPEQIRTKGFNLDEQIEESYPDPQEEVNNFNKSVQAEVRKQLDVIEKKAYEDGFEKAKEEGYNAGLAVVQEKVEPYITEMMEMCQNFRKIRDELVLKNEMLIVNTMTRIIEKIIMMEYQSNSRMIKSMIGGVVKMTGEREDIEISLSKYDYDRINEFSKELSDELGLKNKLRLEVDNSIQKGGCKVITNLGLIDASIDQQFRKMDQEMKSAIPKPASNLVKEMAVEKIKKATQQQSEGIAKPTMTREDVKQKTVQQGKVKSAVPPTAKPVAKKVVLKKEEIKSEDVANVVKKRIKKDD